MLISDSDGNSVSLVVVVWTVVVSCCGNTVFSVTGLTLGGGRTGSVKLDDPLGVLVDGEDVVGASIGIKDWLLLGI